MANTTVIIDGEEFEDVDLSLLTTEQVHDYRLQLSQILHERGEVFLEDIPTDKIYDFYVKKIQECREYIGTD